jgi:hypothetical protein
MRPAKHSDGSEYYEYILLYTDDCLVISENAEPVLRNELIVAQYSFTRKPPIPVEFGTDFRCGDRAGPVLLLTVLSIWLRTTYVQCHQNAVAHSRRTKKIMRTGIINR